VVLVLVAAGIVTFILTRPTKRPGVSAAAELSEPVG
jgi:hypothetical protein